MSGIGLELGTWARIEDDCPIEYVALRHEVEMTVGGRQAGFDLVVTEGGLETLIATGQAALAALRERMAAADDDD
jgi:hypothetical protein